MLFKKTRQNNVVLSVQLCWPGMTLFQIQVYRLPLYSRRESGKWKWKESQNRMGEVIRINLNENKSSKRTYVYSYTFRNICRSKHKANKQNFWESWVGKGERMRLQVSQFTSSKVDTRAQREHGPTWAHSSIFLDKERHLSIISFSTQYLSYWVTLVRYERM